MGKSKVYTKDRVDQKVVVQVLGRKRKKKDGPMVNDKSMAFTVDNISVEDAFRKARAAFESA